MALWHKGSMRLALILLNLFPITAYSIELRGPANPEIYECKAIIYSQTDKVSEDYSFAIGKNGGAHGGQSFEFSKDLHKLMLQVDGRWLSMRWERGDKMIAQSVFLLGPNDSAEMRVGIMVDPSNTDNHVSLGCNRI